MFILFPKFKLRVSVFSIPAAILLYWSEGGFPFAILLFSALLHELGHLSAVWILGYRVRRIDLLPMGALIVLPEGIPHEKEWKIAISGPLVSLLLAAVSAILFAVNPNLPMLYSVVINLVLALFNLLPIRLLDGGKALLCFLKARQLRKNPSSDLAEKKTERICSVISNISLVAFAVIIALCLSAVGYNLGALLLSAVLLVQLTGKL